MDEVPDSSSGRCTSKTPIANPANRGFLLGLVGFYCPRSITSTLSVAIAVCENSAHDRQGKRLTGCSLADAGHEYVECREAGCHQVILDRITSIYAGLPSNARIVSGAWVMKAISNWAGRRGATARREYEFCPRRDARLQNGLGFQIDQGWQRGQFVNGESDRHATCGFVGSCDLFPMRRPYVVENDTSIKRVAVF